jgi:iron complex transport system ATP-binding protein
METIQLKDLSIGYQTKGIRKVVASSLNGAISSGELTCLLGQNGIGKSTLLRTLSAFQPALSGEVLIQREQPTAISLLSDKELSRLIGVVLTEKPDVRNMTVEELVGLGRSPYTDFWGRLDADDRRIVDESIRLVAIDALRGRMVHTLSDGERQKVMIAKALAQQTPVVYLDEPTAFLDFPSKVECMQLLRRLAHDEQKTIFLSTHDVELSLQVADRLWLMEPGMLSVGTPRELADQGVLRRFICREGITFDEETLTIHVR